MIRRLIRFDIIFLLLLALFWLSCCTRNSPFKRFLSFFNYVLLTFSILVVVIFYKFIILHYWLFYCLLLDWNLWFVGFYRVSFVCCISGFQLLSISSIVYFHNIYVSVSFVIGKTIGICAVCAVIYGCMTRWLICLGHNDKVWISRKRMLVNYETRTRTPTPWHNTNTPTPII